MLKTKSVGDALLLYWRYEHGGTARSLARALDVTPTTIHGWARGQDIPHRHWKKILAVTGLDLRQYHPHGLENQGK